MARSLKKGPYVFHKLWAKVQKANDSTKKYWALSSAQYIKEAIKNMEAHLKTRDRKLYPVHQPMHTESDCD